MGPVEKAFVSGFVPLFVLQCLSGVWMLALSRKGRKGRLEGDRSKAKDAALQESNRQQLQSLEKSLADIEAAIREALMSGGAIRPEFKSREVTLDQAATRPAKLGIALSGGGGKGAYEVGALRVLRAAGVRPDVIAGTSVGAINAALLCLDDMEVAAGFWSTISFWQVARVGIANLAALPLVFFSLITAGGSDGIDGPMRRMILMPYYAVLVTVNVFGVLYLGWPWLAVAVNVLACASIVTLGYSADYLVGLLGLALFSNAPLSDTIQATVAPDRLRAAGTPTYVTVAARRRIVDPNHPLWLDPGKRTLVGRQPYVPEYRCLQEETDLDIHRLVLQSAAIPFGVFPLRRIGRSGYVDGGVADNVPIQPLIDAGCTCIVVIHLNDEADCDGWRLTDQDDLWGRLGQLRELRRLAALGREHTIEDITQQARMRAASPSLRREETNRDLLNDHRRSPVTFVHIVPSEPLGGIFKGTMNFRATKARHLIELGGHDAQLKLQRSPELAAWTSQVSRQ
jgi:hypothetical protein